MASAKERWLTHWYFRLHQKNRPKEPLEFGEALDALESIGVAGTAEATHKSDRWITQLVSIDRTTHDGFAILLFLGIDKDRAQAVYGDTETLNLRTVKKKASEGGAVSAHLMIRLASDPGLTGNYAILEEVEGLSKSNIVPYLRWLLDKFVTFIDINDHGEEVNIKAMLNDDTVLDKPIAEQLNNAALIAVSVFRKTKDSTIDKRLDYFEKTRAIEFRPIKKVRGPAAISVIERVLAGTDLQEYPEVRIRIEEKGGNERTVGGDRSKQDALMRAFQLRTFVGGISPPLEEASKKPAVHLAAAIRKHFPKLKT